MAWQKQAGWQVLEESGRRKYVNRDERQRFLAGADQLPPAPRALCYTLVFTGCRVSEALSLRSFQLDGSRQTITVQTLKRRRLVFRSIPVPRELITMLQALEVPEGGQFWKLHRANAWRLIQRTMLAAGVRGPMANCKGLRHGYGIHAASHNVPPNLIQRWMGHSDPSTTAIYLDAVGVEERAFAERMWEEA